MNLIIGWHPFVSLENIGEKCDFITRNYEISEARFDNKKGLICPD